MYKPQPMDRFLHNLTRGLEYLHWAGALVVVVGMTVLPWSNLPFRLLGCTDALLPNVYSVGLNVTRSNGPSIRIQAVISYLLAAIILVLLASFFHDLAAMSTYAKSDSEERTPVTPFNQANLRHLHGMGRCLIALAVIFSGVPMVIGFAEGAMEATAEYTATGASADRYGPMRESGFAGYESPIHITMEDNFTVVALLVLAAIVVYALARILAYGITLQREDDGLI